MPVSVKWMLNPLGARGYAWAHVGSRSWQRSKVAKGEKALYWDKPWNPMWLTQR